VSDHDAWLLSLTRRGHRPHPHPEEPPPKPQRVDGDQGWRGPPGTPPGQRQSKDAFLMQVRAEGKGETHDPRWYID
jgi:hypothetical protein